MTAQDLTQEYRRNPKRGFDLIYQAFADRLTTYLRRSYTLSLEEVADVVHDAFLPWVAEPERMGQVTNVSAYLFATVRNLALQAKKHRLNPVSEAFDPAGPAFQEQIDSTLHIEQTLKKLPEEQREAVSLKIWGDLSFEEIAEVQGVPLQTAAARYRYGLQKLEEMLSRSNNRLISQTSKIACAACRSRRLRQASTSACRKNHVWTFHRRALPGPLSSSWLRWF